MTVVLGSGASRGYHPDITTDRGDGHLNHLLTLLFLGTSWTALIALCPRGLDRDMPESTGFSFVYRVQGDPLAWR